MKILFVGLSENLHAARHIRQLDGLGWDLHFFSVYNGGAHELLRDITVHQFFPNPYARLNAAVTYRNIDWPYPRAREFIRKRISAMAWAQPPRRLARLIKRLQPDMVHSMGLQHGGYLTLEALKILGKASFPRWVVSNWGSDIQFNGQFEDDAARIKAVLENADEYTCECERDVELARQFGFKGNSWPVIPNAGGVDLQKMRTIREQTPPSQRRKILIKGYQHWYGRALVALKAVEWCAPALRNYSIGIYGLYAVGEDVRSAAHLVARRTGVPITIIPPCPHDEMLKLHAESRASISLSITDGICTSFLEAASAGAFPIQSNTSCASEWAKHGRSALFVDPDDPHDVAEQLKRVLADDRLVDDAAGINWSCISTRLDASVLGRKVADCYRGGIEKPQQKAE